MRRFLLVAAAALATTVVAGCAPAPAPKPAPIDAVFLIVIDTLRPDVLSCYGYQGHTTAAIDRLAASGVRFENAASPASWTVPSTGSIMTSRYPTQLGLVERPPPSPHRKNAASSSSSPGPPIFTSLTRIPKLFSLPRLAT